MDFVFYTNPVTFCIIKNFYSEDEIKLIHEELARIEPYLGGPEKTGTARTVQHTPKKYNKGVFLDDLYRQERNTSAILKLNRKVFSPSVVYKLQEGNCFFKYLDRTNHDSTLVSLYNQNNYYDSHEDESFITAIYYTWKEPQMFEGGDLFFGDFKVPISNNCLLVFPSITEHRVTPVTKGYGRYSISQFISYERQIPRPNINRFVNFLSISEFDKVWSIVRSKPWSHTGFSIDSNSVIFEHMDLIQEPYFSEYLVDKIKRTTNMNFRVDRVYANGQVFGQDGSFHSDSQEPNTFTFLLYMNKIENIDEWGGETQFKFYDDQLSVFQPETNSALLFNSTLLHRGLGPSRRVNDMRVTIAWKFTRIE